MEIVESSDNMLVHKVPLCQPFPKKSYFENFSPCFIALRVVIVIALLRLAIGMLSGKVSLETRSKNNSTPSPIIADKVPSYSRAPVIDSSISYCSTYLMDMDVIYPPDIQPRNNSGHDFKNSSLISEQNYHRIREMPYVMIAILFLISQHQADEICY